MSSFTDASGREWSLNMDWGAMRRSRQAGVDLSMFEELLGDFYRGSDKLITALWAVVEPWAKSREFSREAFEDGVSGEVISTAREALVQSVVAFLPRDRAEMIVMASQDVQNQLAELAKASSPSASIGSVKTAE